MDPGSWNCRKKRRMPIRKRYVSVITGSRYWKICFWSLKKMQKKTKQELQEMEKRALKAEKQRDDALDKVKELQHQFYETAVRLEEEQGKNLKLRAQINRDYEKFFYPFFQKHSGRKKITNSREKTGRKPGGQPGHKDTAAKNRSRPGRQSFSRLRK